MRESIIIESISPDEFFLKMREIISEELNKRLKPDLPQLYITKKETAAKLRLSLTTLGHLTTDGTLKGYQVGRRVLYRADEIDQALKEIPKLTYRKTNGNEND
jgi:excisionase family DNA binding protein